MSSVTNKYCALCFHFSELSGGQNTLNLQASSATVYMYTEMNLE